MAAREHASMGSEWDVCISPAVGAVAEMTDPIAWASEVFAPFNLSWKEAPAVGIARRVLGNSADRQAIVDVTIRAGKVIAASAVVPIKPEYTPLLMFLLAVLVESATRQEADAWLARGLNRLRRDRSSAVVYPWHDWRVTLTTTAIGLLTMQVR